MEKYVLQTEYLARYSKFLFPGAMSPSVYNTAYLVLHFWNHLWQSFLGVWLLLLPFNPDLSAQSCSSCPAGGSWFTSSLPFSSDLQWSKSSDPLACLGSFVSVILLSVQNVCFPKSIILYSLFTSWSLPLSLSPLFKRHRRTSLDNMLNF